MAVSSAARSQEDWRGGGSGARPRVRRAARVAWRQMSAGGSCLGPGFPGRVASPGARRSRGAPARRDTGRLFPSGPQEALLRAALLPVPEALHAWRTVEGWLGAGRPDPGTERLLPLAWANLTRQGVREPGLERLAAVHEAARARTEGLLARAGPVLAALHRAGIPTLVLKGAALVTGYYKDAGLRPMSDLDVLVPTGAAAAAAAALRAGGWIPRHRWSPRAVALTHATAFDGAGGDTLDLHWHVFAECCRPGDDEDLWARAVPVEIGGVATRALAPADQLLHVLVHGEKWVRIPGIRWVADAVHVLRSGAVDPPRLVAQAVRRRFVLRVSRQLAYLRAAIDPALGQDLLAALALAPVSRLERLEQALGVRERRPANSLLAHWFTHARSARLGLAGAALSFPGYLQAIWHLEGWTGLPGAVIARAGTRLRR